MSVKEEERERPLTSEPPPAGTSHLMDVAVNIGEETRLDRKVITD
jgi:hypothetical protein